MISVAVVGARGYLGRIAVGLLLGHPHVDTVVPVSTGRPGTPYGALVPAFGHLDELLTVTPDADEVADADAVLLATDDETAASIVPELPVDTVVIDLSRAHRSQALTGPEWAYGLSDLPQCNTSSATRIANPGCYPTATLVGAAPLAIAGLVHDGPVIVNGISGVSGAGATPRPDLHYAETNESVRAYKVAGHDHATEMRLALAALERGTCVAGPNGTRPVRFTPHLVPQNRGLLSTVCVPVAEGVTQDEVDAAYEKVFAGSAFVRLVEEPNTAVVRGSNFADVAAHLDEDAGLVVTRCAIDNLVKGGAGSAVQNLNHAFGFDVTSGLEAPGGGP